MENNFSQTLYIQREKISWVSSCLMSLLTAIFLVQALDHVQNNIAKTEFFNIVSEPDELPPRPVEERKQLKQLVQPTPQKEVKNQTVKSQNEVVQTTPSPVIESSKTSENSDLAATSKSNSNTQEYKQERSATLNEKTATQEPVKQIDSSASHSYEAIILGVLEKNKRYPTSREARLSHPEGTVKVWLELNRKGDLTNCGISLSSGSNILDGEALKTIKSATFPPFPEKSFPSEESHRFIANLKYSLITN